MTKSKQYHIHIDADTLDPSLERVLLEEMGFFRMDFERHDGEGECYAPLHHFTKKIFGEAGEFTRLFDRIEAMIDPGGVMTGYVEGEYLPLDEDLEVGAFNPKVPVPFRLEMAQLAGGQFRQSEVHVTFDKERTDPRLIACLSSTGMFSAFLPKSYGTAQVLTAQGTREAIRDILGPLRDYLTRAGGAHRLSIKEEQVIRWWASSADVRLAPVIAAIHWTPGELNQPTR